MELRLARLENRADCIRGVLYIEGEIAFVTLELPWRDNKQNVSCIPTGRYRCVREFSKHLNTTTFELKNVPGRGEVKFHGGTIPAHSLGCPLLGHYFELGHSAIGPGGPKPLIRFMERMNGVDDAWLDVVDLCFNAPKPIEGPKIL